MMTADSETCGVAFKEWAGVCDALVDGRQTIIVRKGGISEAVGPGGFAPEYREFWLYPTGVHQAEQGLRTSHSEPPGNSLVDEPRGVLIKALARVDLVGYVATEASLPVLEAFHVFTKETMTKRFHYRRPGLWVLVTRVWRANPGYVIESNPEHAGCKTWVDLEPALATAGLEPVLGDALWADQCNRLKAILPS